jgi:hypothetical protein
VFALKITRVFRPLAAALVACVLAVCLASCGSTSSPVAKPAKGSFKTEGKGYRFDCNGWVYVHVEGSPYERGFQNGKLVAPEIKSMIAAITFAFKHDMSGLWKSLTGGATKIFMSKIDPEYIQEMQGIADGARAAGVDVSLADIVTLNGSIELKDYWYPNFGKTDTGVTSGGCSAFIATGKYTADGKPVVAHNTWSPYLEGQEFNIITDIKPDKGHRILMQSMPGGIFSAVDFFVTDARIMGTETTISGYSDFDVNGTPEFIRARRAMQYANNLDDFVALMRQGNNGGYANSWLIGDAASGEILRFEQGMKHDKVQRTRSGYYVGSNGPSDDDLRNLETSGSGYFNIKGSVGARRVRLQALMDENIGSIDVPTGQAIISDHYDVYLREDKPGVRTVEGRGDMDSAEYTAGTAYYPQGALDGKVMDAREAMSMSFDARWGSSSGLPFDAKEFLEEQPQFSYMAGHLKSRPTEPWTLFKAGMK